MQNYNLAAKKCNDTSLPLDIVRMTKTQLVWRPQFIITVCLEAAIHFTQLYISR